MDKIWWEFAVIRGKDLPTDVDGKWFEIGPVSPLPVETNYTVFGVKFEATHEWEQREDGAVAVVYRRFDG